MNCMGFCFGHSCAGAGSASAARAAKAKIFLSIRVTCIPGPSQVAADSRRESKEDIAFARAPQHPEHAGAREEPQQHQHRYADSSRQRMTAFLLLLTRHCVGISIGA